MTLPLSCTRLRVCNCVWRSVMHMSTLFEGENCHTVMDLTAHSLIHLTGKQPTCERKFCKNQRKPKIGIIKGITMFNIFTFRFDRYAAIYVLNFRNTLFLLLREIFRNSRHWNVNCLPLVYVKYSADWCP